MVLDYWDKTNSIDEVIEHLRNFEGCGAYDPDCATNPVCTSPRALVEVAQNNYALQVNAHESWTLEEVHQSLHSQIPIIADIFYNLEPGAFGHFVVIYGIRVEEEQTTIFYHDPYDGASQEAKWTGEGEFAGGWQGPVDTGDPCKTDGHEYWGMAAHP
jgi:hypothetical protein